VPSTGWVRTLLVVALLALGGLICVFSLVRWARIERAMRLREPLPAFGLGVVMTVALALISLLLVIVLI
jgi:putative membrane protein